MIIKGELIIFLTTVEPTTTGSKTFSKEDGLFDITEIRKAMHDRSKFVVICNDVSAHSEATKKQFFIMSDEVTPEEGYEEAYTMVHYGRSSSGAVNRKMVLNFKGTDDNPELKVNYFGS